MKVLGVTSTQRVEVLPNVPTIAEAGVPGYNFYLWVGMLAPAGTPKDVLEKLSKAQQAVLAMPEVKARFRDEGSEVMPMSPDRIYPLPERRSGRDGQGRHRPQSAETVTHGGYIDRSLRLHRRRGRHRRLRRCEPPVRAARLPSAAARSRPAGRRFLDQDARRHGQAVQVRALQLALLHRARAHPGPSQALLAARQDTRRQQRNQRHGAPPRQPGRLRPLGAPGQRRLELGRGLALLQALGIERARRRSLSRRRRPALRRRPVGDASDRPRFRRSGTSHGIARHR